VRPRNQNARDQLTAALARRRRASASELAADVGVSVPTLHRLLKELAGSVVAAGAARRARYALRRSLRGDLSELPLYEIDPQGRASPLAQVSALHPEGTWMGLDGTSWPVPDDARDGWWDGLPYPLYDMRPQGFMGRQFARAQHRRLGVPDDPTKWGDDDILHALNHSGSDTGGNLILGNPAFELWAQTKAAPPQPLKAARTGQAYAGLAEQAVASGVGGSSAGCEFPKFPALRELAGSTTPHVLVKFSGADGSSVVQRWSDLLVCEHLALECAASMPEVESPRSRILQNAGRTFLEVERFDRHGLFGRSRLCSLDTLNAAFLGESTSDWSSVADRLAGLQWLGAHDALRIKHLWWFGRLIANTDMHAGNLSFRPGATAWALAPAYDMLPMMYAPLAGGEIPPREFTPPVPLPAQQAIWLEACRAATVFWQRAGGDGRIGPSFRSIATANAEALDRLAGLI
jgi:hypothetical protein